MASAFISYAHEDREFVLQLYEHLRERGLDVRFDQVALHIGDSLIRAISQEIADGDFLVAIVSPDSVESEWCQTELSLARTQGINERRVKVLPVRYRGADMPSMLQDTFWGDADNHDVETLARQLAAAMATHLGGGDEASAIEAAEAAKDADGEPPHAELPGDAGVGQIDQVADKVWDVLAQWERSGAGEPMADLTDKRRRLRWALDALPESLRASLPLVVRLGEGDWSEYFRLVEPTQAEPDLRDELRSVRAQLAQGLPVTRRWTLEQDFGQVSAGSRDAVAYLWSIARGEETRRVTVFISGTALTVQDEGLPQEVAQAKQTQGRSVVATLLALDDPPQQVMVSTAGVSWPLPD